MSAFLITFIPAYLGLFFWLRSQGGREQRIRWLQEQRRAVFRQWMASRKANRALVLSKKLAKIDRKIEALSLRS